MTTYSLCTRRHPNLSNPQSTDLPRPSSCREAYWSSTPADAHQIEPYQ
jgi:hypothetical protein